MNLSTNSTLPAVIADLGHSSETALARAHTNLAGPRLSSGKNPHRRRRSRPCRLHSSHFHPAESDRKK